jgi:tripartite-type tricarboxylate transporter receptor subunit TctC
MVRSLASMPFLFFFVAALSGFVRTAGKAAAAEADFFSGKTLRIVVPYTTGGAYDRLARAVASHIQDYIPGKPTVVVQNMPGGGGAVATNHLYVVAPKDGTVMAILNAGLVLAQLIGAPEAKFDMGKFGWLGSLQRVNVACMVSKGSGVADFADLLGPDKREVKFGATGVGSTNFIWPTFLRDIGAQIRVVTGYGGASDIYLAIQRGEVEGACSTWDAMRVSARELHRIGAENGRKAITKIILQTGSRPAHDLPEVPLIGGFLKRERDRVLARVLAAPDEVTRAFAVPPGVPAERLALLRKALQDVLADRKFNELVKKTGDELSPASAEHVEKVIGRVLGETPKELIPELKRLLKG